ncbi:MAG: hypothetical protein VKP62_10795 [Candidatus Sericytochromatia bacterium]|nr:hypothetical protein [Candidatus Sericytochromatia bacterium]
MIRPITWGAACWALITAQAIASAQAVYHVEKDVRHQGAAWNNSSDPGLGAVRPVSGFYRDMLERDVQLHAFAWRDGYSTTDGQPTYSVQVSLHREPPPQTRIPDVTVGEQVVLARPQRSLEWRIPIVAATYYIFPQHANVRSDPPLAVMTGKKPEDGFRASISGLTSRNFLVRALVQHQGTDGVVEHNFQRNYVFRPPTVEVVDGRHEAYELYHWFW